MNNLKSIVLAAALLFSVAIMAQNQEARKQGKAQQLTEQLGLSEQQQEEVALIFKEIRKEKQSIKANESLTPADKKKASKELKDKSDAKLKSALTKEQYAKYISMKQERLEARKLEKTQKQEAFYEELKLTEKQIVEMESLNEKIKAQKKAIRDNTSMTEDQKKTVLKELRVSKEKTTQSILTEEQYKQLQEMKKQKRGEKGKGRMMKERKQK